MFMQKETRDNLLGSAVFVFLIYLFLCAFAEDPGKGQDARSDFKNTSELYSDPAAIVQVQQIDFLNSQLPSAENFRLKQESEEPKLISFNKTILQKITFLEKTRLLIKPVLHPRFYNQFYASETDDPLI